MLARWEQWIVHGIVDGAKEEPCDQRLDRS
jgi:hypothetical protein